MRHLAVSGSAKGSLSCRVRAVVVKGWPSRQENYPAGFVFYKMCQAGMLQGLTEDIDVSKSWQFVVIDDDRRRKSFLEKNPNSKLTLSFRNVPQDFGRTLAKIGYGHVLTELNLEDFRPICVPYILGYKANVSHIVGGSLDDQAPEPGNGYSMRTVGFGTAYRIVLVALIRLLANTSAPAYHVVVGDVVGFDRVKRIIRRPGIIVEGPGSTKNSARGFPAHWMPQVWPVPFLGRSE